MKMTPFDWEELEHLTQPERIARLKQRGAELCDGEMFTEQAADAPSDVIEQFWRRIIRYEEEELGIVDKPSLPPLEFPDPDQVPEAELNTLLWQKIGELAERRIYLEQTDHLSDRELFRLICSAKMRALSTEVVGEDSAIHFDVLGGYGEEEIELYLTYYADEETREQWRREWPDVELPAKTQPPYDRDQYLPRPHYW